MNEEELKKFNRELKELESDVKNKSTTVRVRKKRDLRNKKVLEDLKNHSSSAKRIKAAPRLKSKNWLLNMATG